jgi:guanylate kinase
VSTVLLILSAPSGTGKTTLARRLVLSHPDAIFSVSYTTRAPRGKERDGVDYHFVDEARFAQMVAEGAFLEHAEVHGHRYGTPRAVVDEARRRGALAVFDIDVQGGEAIRAQHPEAVRVLILPPSLEELERRLRSRSTDDDATVRRRLEAARREMLRARSYEYWVVNDDLERASGDLEAIVRAERCRAGTRDLTQLGL